MILIECHLFDDFELDQEIIKTFMFNDIIQNNSESENKLKILLVMSTFDCESNRGIEAFKVFNKISDMFPNHEIKKGIGLIISKCESELTGSNYVDRLNDNSPEKIKEWWDFFSQYNENIFTFPDISDEMYEFEDQDRIIDFIQDDYIDYLEFKFT